MWLCSDRDHAAETGAERANHPGQSDVSDREVVVAREDLDENRSARRELVASRQRRQRLMGDRHRLILQHRRFVLAEAEDEVAVTDRLELVERIHEPEQIERDDVKGIDGK